MRACQAGARGCVPGDRHGEPLRYRQRKRVSRFHCSLQGSRDSRERERAPWGSVTVSAHQTRFGPVPVQFCADTGQGPQGVTGRSRRNTKCSRFGERVFIASPCPLYWKAHPLQVAVRTVLGWTRYWEAASRHRRQRRCGRGETCSGVTQGPYKRKRST